MIYSSLGKLILILYVICAFIWVWSINHGFENGKDLQESISKGKYYVTKCKLQEVDIDNGFLSAKSNKLICDGVIVNVRADVYNQYVAAYNESLKKIEN
ncbi:hypothetical protein FZI27_20245 [Cronobacter sakazakii]|nr:hypothetical protein FZI27_20245 [Cronobacter sakazakii]